MFKAIKKLKSDKKGFTLVELLVTSTVLLIALTLTVELFGVIYKNYELVEQRWIVQTEVEYIMSAFQKDTENNALITAYYVDLLYEDLSSVTNEFANIPNGTFSEDAATGILTFQKVDTTHGYLFLYKDYFYVLDRGQATAQRFCLTDETQVDISFKVATNVNPLETTGAESGTTAASHPKKYLPDGISVTVESGDIYPTKYALNTSFVFNNMQDGRKINITNGFLSNVNVAGWTNGTGLENYPTAAYYEPGKTAVNYTKTEKPANLIRYVSASAYFAQADFGAGTANAKFVCLTNWLMADSSIKTPVVNSLRDFRNNVLKGTVIGDFIIEKYYSWSPSIIDSASDNVVAKALLKAMIIPAAVVAFFVAE